MVQWLGPLVSPGAWGTSHPKRARRHRHMALPMAAAACCPQPGCGSFRPVLCRRAAPRRLLLSQRSLWFKQPGPLGRPARRAGPPAAAPFFFMEEGRRVLEEFRRALHANAAARKRCARKMAAAQPSKDLLLAAGLVHWLSGNMGPALRFVAARRPGGQGQAEEIEGQLSRLFHTTSPAERRRLTTAPESAAESARLRRAQKFLAEQRLHEWLEETNITKGIAPLSTVVLQRSAQGEGMSPPPALAMATSRKSKLQWLRRWRRRWGVSMARLPPGDRPPPEECQRKAGRGQEFP